MQPRFGNCAFSYPNERGKPVFVPSEAGRKVGRDLKRGLNQRSITGRKLNEVLENCHAPYRVLDDGETIAPIASAEEGETLERAFDDLAASEYSGARGHLRKAAEALTTGRNADSIRESIHAVEAVARTIAGTPSLSAALSKIEGTHRLHAALKKGVLALYGFTSDEQGIRHPLLDKDAPEVDETDALFMIGACAAFVSYLTNRTREAANK